MKLNIIKAYIISPPVVPIVYMLFVAFLGNSIGGSFYTATDMILIYLIGGSILSYIGFLVIIVPIYKYLRYRNNLSYLSMFVAGSIVGLIIMLIILMLLLLNQPENVSFKLQEFELLIGFCLASGSGAVAFAWLAGEIKQNV